MIINYTNYNLCSNRNLHFVQTVTNTFDDLKNHVVLEIYAKFK